MDIVNETITYSEYVRPVRRGLHFLVLYFAISLSVAALIFQTNLEDFLLVCIPIVFPGAVVPFVAPWSRARDLASQLKTVSVTHDAVRVNDAAHDLSKCRWFHGFSFHDPKLADYPTYAPAVIITWPPFDNDSRTICGLDLESRAILQTLLSSKEIPQDMPRRRNERFLLHAASVGTAAVLLGVMYGTNLVVTPAIPLPSVIITAAIGAIAVRIWVKQQLGHIQFQVSTSHTFAAWASLIVIGTLRLHRRNRGGPLLQNAAFLTWVVPLAFAQAACLFLLYMHIRTREELMLGIHSNRSNENTSDTI